MATRGTAFLMYHELGIPGRATCQSEPGYVRYVIPASDFRDQMEWLAKEGWRGRNVTQAMESFGDKSVCITFDDGCETDLISAAPVLKELGFVATSYITVEFLGKQANFRTMATSQTGVNLSTTDPFALTRVTMLKGTNSDDVLHYCQGKGLLRTELKEKARDAAKLLLGNSIYDSLRSLIVRGRLR